LQEDKVDIGAKYLGDGKCRFAIWAPYLDDLSLVIVGQSKRIVSSKKDDHGYWIFEENNVIPGTKYYYRLESSIDRPDPASHSQPEGIHGHSQVVDHEYPWNDHSWRGISLDEMIIYELHIGTFTEEGTFEAVIPRLDDLKDLGINALEIMPVGQFPGKRNWGYDGAFPFAVQNSYGGPYDFKRMINACHACGLAVILDVVYNHLGPEGTYLAEFGPYFTDKYKTPWGKALNFDGACSEAVRDFFFENALYWLKDFHLDALRLDAIHAIFDMSAKPFLRELAEKVFEFSNRDRKRYLIAESDLNDIRIIDSWTRNGFGIDAQYCDDFHHALHVLLTNELSGYYQDFGRTEDLVKAFKEGFVYSWDFSKYRNRRHGSSSQKFLASRFVVFSQNHDQVGNRPLGERLSTLVSFEALKLAAGIVILSPYIPQIFMGEEYGDESPFLYFTGYTDSALAEAVREARQKEAASSVELPDPQDISSFFRSRLCWQRRSDGRHKVMLEFYKKLIHLRKEIPALRHLSKVCQDVSSENGIIYLKRWHGSSETMMIMNFCQAQSAFWLDPELKLWKRIMDSSEAIWFGPGMATPDNISNAGKFYINPQSFSLYEKVEP
jgi:maltooligosyltrehalose trehalohydrolase